MQIAIWILLGAALGAGCGWGALFWARRMLENRRRKGRLLTSLELILVIASALWGGITGFCAGGWLPMATALAILTISVAVLVSDGLCRIIPNPTVLAVFALKLFLITAALLKIPGAQPFELLSALGGMVACFLVFSLPGLLGKQVGAGDIKFASAMGFLLEFSGALLAVVIMGLLVLGYSMVQRKMPLLAFLKTDIPMGPFIAAGMMLAYMIGCLTL